MLLPRISLHSSTASISSPLLPFKVLFTQLRKTETRAFSTASIAMAPRPVPLPRSICDSLGLLPSELAFREGSATIVLPSKEAAFLNPVQEFNRDVSTLAIRAWSEQKDEERREKYRQMNIKRGQKKRRNEAGPSGSNDEVNASKRMKSENGVEHNDTAKEGKESNEIVEEKDAEGGLAEQQVDEQNILPSTETGAAAEGPNYLAGYKPYRFTLLEALSATGLRSIRYAREIPLLKTVIANDLSSSAVVAMKRNVALNFPAGKPIEEWVPTPKAASENDVGNAPKQENGNGEATLIPSEGSTAASSKEVGRSASAEAEASKPLEDKIHPQCKVRINEGDAMSVMYSHRDEKNRFDVVDLDPYGSASIFLDGAVQSVRDGGLLCVTCTDLAVLAGTSYPEKCFTSYGGTTTKAEFSHEFALRLVLHAIATSAARYSRYIEPLLSLSIDFYLRVFVRVHTKPLEVKKLPSKTGLVYTCTGCQNWAEHRMGRMSVNEGREKYQPSQVPEQGSTCSECGSRFHTAGPMWLGPLHERAFCTKMLEILDRAPERFGTSKRIHGMVGVAADELEAPFYFTPSKVANFFHCISPPLQNVVSALLKAGHAVSRSHTIPGSIKTTAPRSVVQDVIRSWVKLHPVSENKIKENSPTKALLAKVPEREYDVSEPFHAETSAVLQGSFGGQGTRYQMNPTSDWGPGTAAKTTKGPPTLTKRAGEENTDSNGLYRGPR